MKLVIIETDDENETFLLEHAGNRVEFANTSHDSVGWAGMTAVRDALETFATALGIEISREDAPVLEKDEL